MLPVTTTEGALGLVLPQDAASLADAVVGAVRDGVARGVLDPGETYSVTGSPTSWASRAARSARRCCAWPRPAW